MSSAIYAHYIPSEYYSYQQYKNMRKSRTAQKGVGNNN